MSSIAATSSPGTVIRKLPPVAEIALASLVLVVIGTIYVAASIGREPNLAIPLGLDAVAIALFLLGSVLTARIDDFAWRIFWVVARWSALGYVVIAGMIEYVFVKDGTPGATLATLTLGLALFVLDVVLILSFSVARYQPANA